MDKPVNPYRRGTRVWMLMEGGIQEEFDGLPGWEDLDTAQIGELLGCSRSNVRKLISIIRTQTGYTVPHLDGRTARRGI